MIRKCFWTIVRGFFAFWLLGLSFMTMKSLINNFNVQYAEKTIGEIGLLFFSLYIGIVCVRGALENSNVFRKDKVNPFAKIDFSGWKS